MVYDCDRLSVLAVSNKAPTAFVTKRALVPQLPACRTRACCDHETAPFQSLCSGRPPTVSEPHVTSSRDRHHSRTDRPLRRVTRRLEQRIKFLLADPLGALVRPNRRDEVIPLSEVRSVLIFRYDALGDAVISTPVWRLIKQRYPQVRIGVVGSARNRALLACDPDIDTVYTISRKPDLRSLRELLRARKGDWQIALNLFFSDKTRGAIYARIAAPRGYSATIVREKHAKYAEIYSFVGDRPPLRPPTPMTLQVMEVLRAATGFTATPEEVMPRIVIDPAVDESFAGELTRLVAKHGSAHYVLLNTEAAEAFREWGYDKALELSIALADADPGTLVVWTSGPLRAAHAKAYLAEHAASHPRILYLDTPSVHHLAVAVREARLVISPDTAVIHFAAALGRPIVGLYVEPNEFLPYQSVSTVLYAPDGRTIRSVEVAEVLTAAMKMLSRS